MELVLKSNEVSIFLVGTDTGACRLLAGAAAGARERVPIPTCCLGVEWYSGEGEALAAVVKAAEEYPEIQKSLRGRAKALYRAQNPTPPWVTDMLDLLRKHNLKVVRGSLGTKVWREGEEELPEALGYLEDILAEYEED